MAEAVGANLGRVLTIQESDHGQYIREVNIASNWAFVDEAPVPDFGRSGFVPSDMQIRISVHATFELL